MPTDLEKLKSAFAEALLLQDGIDYTVIEYGKTDGWDSVAHMALISHIEAAFDIMLDTDDVVGLSSFPKAAEILGRYGLKLD